MSTVPDTPEAQARMRAFVANATATKASSSPDQARQRAMDDLRRSFEGPYRVGCQRILAAPMFRLHIADAFNAKQAKENAPRLQQICRHAAISATAMAHCQIGRATPTELVKVTQALIDAGELAAPGNAENIRQMQWRFGIGLDCVGYSRQAAALAAGPAGTHAFRGRADDGMLHTVSNGHFQRASVPTHARPGDLFCLTSPTKGEPGHNVCVYSHRTVTTGSALGQLTGNAAAQRFVAEPGLVHAFEVDSSWGADNGQPYGGVRRDTWLFNERTGTWAWLNPKTSQLETSTRGPQDETFVGSFRPRGTS